MNRIAPFTAGAVRLLLSPGEPGAPRLLVLVPLTALLSVPAFPPLEWRWCAWVALAPLIHLLGRGAAGTGLWLAAGWGYGAVSYGLRFAWLPEALLVKGGLSFPAFAGIVAGGLGLLPLYPAVAIALSRWLLLRWRIPPVGSFPLLYSVQDALLGVTPFGGTPWGSLAATQVEGRLAEWIVPVAGSSALVLAIAAGNALWVWAFRVWVLWVAAARWPAGRLPALALAGGLGAAALLTALPPSGGEALGDGAPAELSALVVPGNLPVNVVADDHRSSDLLRYYLARTLAAEVGGSRATSPPGAAAPGEPLARGNGMAPSGPLLIVWPESAVSGRVEQGKRMVDLYQAAALLGADILFGSNSREMGREHNSAYLVTGERFGFARYDKRELVPFGEYLPVGWRGLLGRKLTAGAEDYLPGEGPPVLESRGVPLGVAICFESILPGHARRAALAGGAALVVLSNDQWLTPAASRHHLLLTALRGLETGREVLVAANGGWSGHLAGGKVTEPRYGEAEPFAVRLGLRAGRTPWVRWGHGALLAVYAAYLLALAGLSRFRPGLEPGSGTAPAGR